jgi:hypothetical protein
MLSAKSTAERDRPKNFFLTVNRCLGIGVPE